MIFREVTIEMSAEDLRACRNIGQNIIELLSRATSPGPEDPEDDAEEDQEDNEILRAFRAYEN